MSKTSFRILVFATLILGIASAVAEFAMERYLPETLQAYRREMNGAEAEMTPQFLMVAFGGLSVLVLWLVGTIGLLFLWRPARILYTLATILSFPLFLAIGPWVQHQVTAFLDGVALFLGGIVWALIYFSPIKEHFERPAESAAL